MIRIGPISQSKRQLYKWRFLQDWHWGKSIQRKMIDSWGDFHKAGPDPSQPMEIRALWLTTKGTMTWHPRSQKRLGKFNTKTGTSWNFWVAGPPKQVICNRHPLHPNWSIIPSFLKWPKQWHLKHGFPKIPIERYRSSEVCVVSFGQIIINQRFPPSKGPKQAVLTSIEQLIDQGQWKKGVPWPNQTLKTTVHCFKEVSLSLNIYHVPTIHLSMTINFINPLALPPQSLVRSVEPPMLGGDPCASYVSSAMTWTLERQWLKRWHAGEFLLLDSSKFLETVHGIPFFFPPRRLKSSTFATT